MNPNVVIKKQIGDLLERITKGTTPNKKLGGFTEEGVNYVKSDAVTYDGRIDASKFAFISEETHAALKRSQLREDDILFSMAGVYLGKNAIVPSSILPANTNQALAILTVDQKLASPHYISYFFRQPQIIDFVNNISGQSAQPNINFEEIKSIGISLPPLRKQSAIAGVLSSLDDKIDLLHRQNKTLEALAETLFRQWFIEEAQDDWEEVELGDFIGTNLSTVSKKDIQGEIRYLDTGSLTEGVVEGYQEFLFADAPSRARRRVEHNNILVSTVRPNQKHFGLMRYPQDDVIVSTGFCVIKADKISPYFVYTFLTSDEMTEYLHMIAEASTSAYPSLKPIDIEAVTFLKPPDKKLEEFHLFSDSTWKKIEKNKAQIQTLVKLRDTLLPKLMSGEVRITLDVQNA